MSEAPGHNRILRLLISVPIGEVLMQGLCKILSHAWLLCNKYSFSQADLLCENEEPVFLPARTKNQLCIPVFLFVLLVLNVILSGQ